MNKQSFPAAYTDQQEIEADAQELIQVCIFELSDRLFGLSIFDVQEILERAIITPVPTTPDFLLGVINLRGDIVPVADIRDVLSLPVKPWTRESRIMILNVKNIRIGILVDAIKEVRRIEKRILEAEVVQAGISDGKFIANILQYADGFLVLLNLDHLYHVIQL